MSEKMTALAQFKDVSVTQVSQGYDDDTFTCEEGEYLVLTETEADKRTEEYIRESLWAFQTDFILSHSRIEENERVHSAFQKMQQELCEDANEIVFAVIEDFDDFVQDAIDADGRGHFLAGYDSEENEVQLDGTWYYIYRTN